MFGLTHCVSCNCRIETGPTGLPNHKCSATHEAARANGNRDRTIMRAPGLLERLADGNEMLGAYEDIDNYE